MIFKKLFQISVVSLSLLSMSSFAEAAPPAKAKTSHKKSHKTISKKRSARRQRIDIGRWNIPSEPVMTSKFIQETPLDIMGNKKFLVTVDTTGFDESFAYNALHANAIIFSYQLLSF